jgi:hypothetical protein
MQKDGNMVLTTLPLMLLILINVLCFYQPVQGPNGIAGEIGLVPKPVSITEALVGTNP